MTSFLENIFNQIKILHRTNELEVDLYTLNRMKVILKYIESVPKKINSKIPPIIIDNNDEEYLNKSVEKCIFCDSYFRIENIQNHCLREKILLNTKKLTFFSSIMSLFWMNKNRIPPYPPLLLNVASLLLIKGNQAWPLVFHLSFSA